MDIRVADWRDTLTAAKGQAALVLTDPPYNTTRNAWEFELDPAEFYHRAFKACPGGAVVATTAEPFTSRMVLGAGKHFKYCAYWDKKLPTGHLNAKKQPLRRIEPVVVAYRQTPKYHPQMTVDPRGERGWHRRNTESGSYNAYGEHEYASGGQKYPTTLIEVYQAPKTKAHPTEKPVELMEWFVNTYTDPDDLVVDPFCGTGAVAVACRNTGRRFLGGDITEDYIAIARERTRDL
jgi:site-specific DNA-methyltransferase (adenine-specific)